MNSATPVQPSPWYYLLAVPFFAVGAGFLVRTLLDGFLHLTDSLTQVVVPGEAELTLKQGQPYTVFFRTAIRSERKDLLDRRVAERLAVQAHRAFE